MDETVGEQYTLTVESGVLQRASDGTSFLLDDEQVAQTASALAEVIQNDPSIPALETLPRPGQCDGSPGNPCDASGIKRGAPADPQAFAAGQKRHNNYPPLLIRQASASTPSRGSTRALGGVSIFSLADGTGDMCTNIINAAMPTTVDYHGKRTSFLKEAFDGIVGTLVPLPKGSVRGAKFASGTMNAVMAGVAIGFLRGKWNDYNCAGQGIVAGPYYHANGTYTQISATTSYSCHSEVWEISWDNGNTWDKQTVTVCDFTYQK